MSASDFQRPALSWQRRLLRRPARWLLRLMGWRVGSAPPPIPKFVMVGAPHTSNWDSVFGLATTTALGVKINFLMKHTLMRSPGGWILHLLGGIPIDRTSSMDMAQQILDAFAREDYLIITIAPEGTRSRVDFWKAGFYEIAERAGVPIVLSYVDYGRKEAGFGPIVPMTDDIDADMAFIREYYSHITPKYPEKAGPIRLRPYVKRNRERARRAAEAAVEVQAASVEGAPPSDDENPA